MKVSILTTLLLLLISSVFGQPQNRLLLLDKVPVMIETDAFIDSLEPGNKLTILEGFVKLSVASRPNDIAFRHYFTVGKPLATQLLHRIEYRLTGASESDWIAFDPTQRELFEGTLKPGSYIKIEFRLRNTTKPLGGVEIKREEQTPIADKFCIISEKDTAIDDTKLFLPLSGNRIEIPPAHMAYIHIKPIKSNLDSVLEYRVSKAGMSKSFSWQETGHLITIPELETNEHYQLEIRYREMDTYSTINITTLPQWHQKTKTRIILAIVLLTILFFIVYVVILFRKKYKLRNRQLAAEKLKNNHELLAPHMTNNLLASIRLLLTNGEHGKATRMIEQLSRHIQSSLRKSHHQIHYLTDEINFIQNYIETLNHQYSFRFELIIDRSVDIEQTVFPKLLLQPAIENAAGHGFNSDTHGNLTIHFSKVDKDLVIIITNSTIPNNKSKHDGNGIGIMVTKEKMEALKTLFPSCSFGFNLHFLDTETQAIFRFGNWLS